MSLKINEESTDDIQSSNDNLNQNLTDISVKEEKILNVEATSTVKVNTLNDETNGDEENTVKNDKEKDILNDDKDYILKDINEINKDNSLVNDGEEDTLKNDNEIDKRNSSVNGNSSSNDNKDASKDVNKNDEGNSLVNDEEKDTSNDTNEIDKPKQRILVCVGVPGSGKTTFSKKLCQIDHIWVRVNQDDLGSRRACEEILRAELKKGKNVIVDRCNFDKGQRKTWIDIAYNHKLQIDAIILDTPYEICEKRILKREDHPTQVHGTHGLNILESFKQMYKLPNYNEGFERILNVRPQEINDCNDDDVKKVMRRLDETPKKVFKKGEIERGGYGKKRPHRGRGRGSYGSRGKNYGGSSGGNVWENRSSGGGGGGSNYSGDRGNAWESRGSRGSTRGGSGYRNGNNNNNNNSKNVANPHYNSNFPPLGNK
ncbi:hypothetical protein RclHR1_01040011 [Rhizophagus clarus]|uniref:P-loop containing nucleoside triphosphate hydrolase protein n=1 Tax=Rhizophagus clarus TaxID=94130 RepID=A0A2Z6QTQ7_9GLOM|nr:hypothetical protein RclHR1_01040011 [Rhizophagus clarus]GES77888.1 P-loop containing nucleoside triphosphate hydrolase protein [Rhizophagus clarus]